MQLSEDQRQAIESGQPISVVIDHTECVLIRKDVYEKVRRLYDDSPWTAGEMNALANQMFDDADSAGPIE